MPREAPYALLSALPVLVAQVGCAAAGARDVGVHVSSDTPWHPIHAGHLTLAIPEPLLESARVRYRPRPGASPGPALRRLEVATVSAGPGASALRLALERKRALEAITGGEAHEMGGFIGGRSARLVHAVDGADDPPVTRQFAVTMLTPWRSLELEAECRGVHDAGTHPAFARLLASGRFRETGSRSRGPTRPATSGQGRGRTPPPPPSKPKGAPSSWRRDRLGPFAFAVPRGLAPARLELASGPARLDIAILRDRERGLEAALARAAQQPARRMPAPPARETLRTDHAAIHTATYTVHERGGRRWRARRAQIDLPQGPRLMAHLHPTYTSKAFEALPETSWRRLLRRIRIR